MKAIVEVNSSLFKKGFFILGKKKQDEVELFCRKNKGKLFLVSFEELKG